MHHINLQLTCSSRLLRPPSPSSCLVRRRDGCPPNPSRSPKWRTFCGKPRIREGTCPVLSSCSISNNSLPRLRQPGSSRRPSRVAWPKHG